MPHAGAQLQALVATLLESLPVQSLFSLLGQGYKLVLGGHQFGGILAHALAAKMLLQLRKEIQMAESLGINLSVLNMTENKVCLGNASRAAVYDVISWNKTSPIFLMLPKCTRCDQISASAATKGTTETADNGCNRGI